MTIAGGAVSRGHRKNRKGTRASGRHATRETTDEETRYEGLQTIAGGAMIEGWQERKRRSEDHTNIGGRRLLSPSTNSQAKYCQPHRPQGGARPQP